MAEKNIALSFSLEQQIEIERIVIDEDREAALQLVEKIKDEIKIRNAVGCKPEFEIGLND